MKETIGERIIALRKANGLTQVQLAERLKKTLKLQINEARVF